MYLQLVKFKVGISNSSPYGFQYHAAKPNGRKIVVIVAENTPINFVVKKSPKIDKKLGSMILKSLSFFHEGFVVTWMTQPIINDLSNVCQQSEILKG